LIHTFPTPIAADAVPAVMPSPFNHEPHPLAAQASALLQQRLAREYGDCPKLGKMFGVLVVRDSGGVVGFLSAFSAMMQGQWQLPGFVPPVCDLAEQARFLPDGSAALAVFTEQLEQLEGDPKRSSLAQRIATLTARRDLALKQLKHEHQAAKVQRKNERTRLQAWDDAAQRQAAMASLALQSQHHKREAINAAQHWREKLEALQQEQDDLTQHIQAVRDARSSYSQALHQRVFDTYVLHNSLGKQQRLSDFYAHATPPAGAGDCAGAKLIHYAVKQGLQPLALAEFWWGASPATGVRHHGQFYPACRGKCAPILPFMLQGIDVEAAPDYQQLIADDEPQLVYEDDALLLVNKPAGLLSAPGKNVKDSALLRLQARYPHCPDLKLVHRLDMATSGLLLLAKTVRANKQLQRQFVSRAVEKRYEALISQHVPQTDGEIDLPLRVDVDDRPRQMVCHQHGKTAITRWQWLRDEGAYSRVYFYPQTGRTHQLRVHAAHRDGLHAAIVGDALYGHAGERLMLHAQRLCFAHPITHQAMVFEAATPF
jgi:tRNA pseudouridine32 synthase/23S rRNA pseudouridine746 synthase